MACSGTPFQEVGLALRKGGGGTLSGKIYLVFLFKLVAAKTINWSYDDESPKEAVEFEYGGLQVHYTPQKPDGTMDTPIPGGWNRVKNQEDTDAGKTPIK
jgi:type VI protein secretion system component Hcp